MSEKNPLIQYVNGSGRPRLILETGTFYTSSGTTAYTSTGITETGSPTFSAVKVNMKVYSWRTVSGVDLYTYAKITAKATGVLTVDGWSNGTPTAGKAFVVNGWIADLPRTQELTEAFEPDNLIHTLYGGDAGDLIDVEQRGWKYLCVLDYSKFASADMILLLAPHLAAKGTDKLILIPRADAPQFQVNVYFASKIELSKFGISPGYRKPVFSFQSKENLAGWPLISGYGTNYANVYGTGL